MRPDRTFRRNFFVIATLHVAFVVGVYLFGSWKKKVPDQSNVVWLEGGSIGGGEAATPGEAAATVAAPPPPPQPEPEPVPVESKPELIPPPPPEPMPPSEIVTPKATPEPSTPKPSTPKPETPKPATPTPTPKPATPKPATPKPTPKATPKPKPKTTPKPATPKPKPKPADDSASDSPTSAGDKPKTTPGASKTAGTSTSTKPGSTGGNGPGTGNGKGPGKAGNGTGASEFGWYFSMLHDRFHARWDQPTSIARTSQDFVTTLKLRISKDGTILSHEIVHSSGDPVMDQSVMTAADRVLQIDPLPAGLATGDVFEVNVAFKLDQGP